MLGPLINVVLRIGLAVMTVEVYRAAPGDRRFAGKGIESRIVAVGAPATLLIPALWLRRRRGRFPVWMDNLYVSMYALDLAGNVLDLYDACDDFDLVPHAHGAGTVTVLAAWLFRLSLPQAITVATAGHALLELQENVSDVIFRTRNVRGWRDTAGDLLAGLAGSLLYAAAYSAFVRTGGREPQSPLHDEQALLGTS
jgi:hypothetical protein